MDDGCRVPTATVVDAAGAQGAGAPQRGPAVFLTRPATAGLLLLLVYVALSFLNDPSGHLGTDTGGKVATLEVMAARGGFDPDVGYWAERWDPEGSLHPLWYTSHVGDRWVNVTTLPALFVAAPLYDLGGHRAALLVPMLGGVAAAFAARAIARRTVGGDGWGAYWVCGLASPTVVYALDFWEHTIGLALMAWAIVGLLDAAERTDLRRSGVSAALGGLAFGAAATMRTEAVAYAVVTVAVTALVVLAARRAPSRAVLLGLTATAGLALPMWANTLLERSVLGTAARVSRAAGTVAGASEAEGSRLSEAVLTAVSLHPVMEAVPYLLGAAAFALLAFVARRGVVPGGDRAPVLLGCGALVALYLLRFVEGPGFVPGLVATTPFAAAGLALGWRSRAARLPIAIALLALPVVWALQYTGGAAPQWGGRYLLASGLVLGAIGVAAMEGAQRTARLTFLSLAVVTSAFGLVWLSQRSHAVAQVGQALVALEEPVVVSGIEHLPRELGSRYLDKLFLTAPGPDERGLAGEVVRQAGYDSFAYVQLAEDAAVEAPEGYFLLGQQRLALFDDVDLRVSRFRATGG